MAKDGGFCSAVSCASRQCQLLSVSWQDDTLSLTFAEGRECLKKIINESVVTSLSQKPPMSLGGTGGQYYMLSQRRIVRGILHKPVTNFMADFHQSTYVWGMLSEAAGSSSAGLSLLISLSFTRQREVWNRRNGEEGKKNPKFSTDLPYFVVQD